MEKFITKRLKRTSDIKRLRGEKVDSIINDVKDVTYEVKLDKYFGEDPTCLIIPSKVDENYHKKLIECWVSLGKNIMNMPSDYSNIPKELVYKLQDISYVLNNLTLSESWQENKMDNFLVEQFNKDIENIKFD